METATHKKKLWLRENVLMEKMRRVLHYLQSQIALFIDAPRLIQCPTLNSPSKADLELCIN